MARRNIGPQSQRGMSLIMLVFIIGLAVTAFLVHAFNNATVRIERDRKSLNALAEAKAALVGYALKHASKPGTLPCSDTNNDGSSDTSGSDCAAYIGRLPWRQLGLPMPRDADGECLWYALSPIMRNSLSVTSRNAPNQLNGNTAGTITLTKDDGTPMAGTVLAVILASGGPVGTQSRSGTGTRCPGDSVASKYLETKSGINNATGNASGSNYTFIQGETDSTFNDKIVFIKAEDLYRPLRGRMVKEILGNVEVPGGPADYFDSKGYYPCPAATPTGNEDCSITTGFVPYNDSVVGLQYAALGVWLNNNGWFDLAAYTYYSPTHVKVTVADSSGSHSCDANMNSFTCSSP